MGPSVSFPLPPRIAKSNRFVVLGINFGELPIPLPIVYHFELTREVLANTGHNSQGALPNDLAVLKTLQKVQNIVKDYAVVNVLHPPHLLRAGYGSPLIMSPLCTCMKLGSICPFAVLAQSWKFSLENVVFFLVGFSQF